MASYGAAAGIDSTWAAPGSDTPTAPFFALRNCNPKHFQPELKSHLSVSVPVRVLYTCLNYVVFCILSRGPGARLRVRPKPIVVSYSYLYSEPLKRSL